MRSRASTRGSPRRVSDTSRENSSDMGGSASSHIIWMARRNVWPAESDEAMRPRASGRAASKALRRLAIRCLTSVEAQQRADEQAEQGEEPGR